VFGADGSNRTLENAHPKAANVFLPTTFDSGHFVSYGSGPDATWEHVVWALPSGRKLAAVRYHEPAYTLGVAQDTDRNRAVLLILENDQGIVDALRYDGTVQRLGVLGFRLQGHRRWSRNTSLDLGSGRGIAALVDRDVMYCAIGDDGLSAPRILGRFDGAETRISLDPLGRFIATANATGKIRIWSLDEGFRPTVLEGPPAIRSLRSSAGGSLLEAGVEEDGNLATWVWDVSGDAPRFVRRFELGGGYGSFWNTAARKVARIGLDLRWRLWSMDAPTDADPLVLSRGDVVQVNGPSWSPRGRWFATADGEGLAVWPLAGRFPVVLRRHTTDINDVVFAPDGSWLASASSDGTVKLWPLTGEPPRPVRTLLEIDGAVPGLAVSPDGERILAGTNGRGNRLLRPVGGQSSTLEGFTDMTPGVAFSPDGRLAAANGGQWIPHEQVIRVWDVATEAEVKVLEVGETLSGSLQFTSDGDLLAATQSGMYRWNVTSGSRELLYRGRIRGFAASADGRRILMAERPERDEDRAYAVFFDADSGTATRLDQYGDHVSSAALDPRNNTVITGHANGDIRVGSLGDGEPHLLLGHEGSVWALAVDPLGRWIASGSQDGTVRLWPMPDLSKPPLHTLPREELIAKLKTLTNMRAVRDAESPTGWAIEAGPFTGWETVPTW
jgi:WD40 repeat protein